MQEWIIDGICVITIRERAYDARIGRLVAYRRDRGTIESITRFPDGEELFDIRSVTIRGHGYGGCSAEECTFLD